MNRSDKIQPKDVGPLKKKCYNRHLLNVHIKRVQLSTDFFWQAFLILNMHLQHTHSADNGNIYISREGLITPR